MVRRTLLSQGAVPDLSGVNRAAGVFPEYRSNGLSGRGLFVALLLKATGGAELHGVSPKVAGMMRETREAPRTGIVNPSKVINQLIAGSGLPIW